MFIKFPLTRTLCSGTVAMKYTNRLPPTYVNSEVRCFYLLVLCSLKAEDRDRAKLVRSSTAGFYTRTLCSSPCWATIFMFMSSLVNNKKTFFLYS